MTKLGSLIDIDNKVIHPKVVYKKMISQEKLRRSLIKTVIVPGTIH